MTGTLALLLLAASGSNVDYERLDGGWIRVTTYYRDGPSVAGPTRAQLRLMAAAERLCGRGRAVSAGTLTLNKVPPNDRATRKRGDLKLSEDYRCLDAPAGQ
jgi:hypothetical protein